MSDDQADYLGKNGFVWWTGVVEDLNDPLKIGRMRVRILGFHTENKTALPTKDLPWAVPLQPITSAATSGVGTSPTGMVRGAWVMGFFRDGKNAQDPVVMGSFAGIPQTLPDTNQGFNDPTGTYPTDDYLGESDVNRLARGQSTIKTVVNSKKQKRVQGIRTALGGAWSEPLTPYKAVYPMNTVTQSRSGHIVEIDDTSAAPRLHIYHTSGSFVEMHPDGTVVDKVVGDDYEIDLKNKKILIKGNATETVDGNKRQLVGGNFAIEVVGNLTTYVHGDHYVHTKGNFYHKIDGTCTIVSSGKYIQVASRIDFNPPEFKAENFPSMEQISSAEPSTEPTSSTRGNELENESAPGKNLKNVQKFDVQVATLEAQKAKDKADAIERREKEKVNSATSFPPAPENTDTISSVQKTQATAAIGGAAVVASESPKDCDSYCSGFTEVEDYEKCLSECEKYNKKLTSVEVPSTGSDASCDFIDGIDVGGLLSPIQDAIGAVGEAIEGVVGEISGAIEGVVGEISGAIDGAISGAGDALGLNKTPEEKYCEEELEDQADSFYNYKKQAYGRFIIGDKTYSKSEYRDYYKNQVQESGLTRLEECIQWCKDNPEEFAEITGENEKDSPVSSLPSLSDLGSILDLNIPIPGLPSIPCLGIGIASIAGIAAGIGAGIAVARAVEGAGGVVAGVVTGAVAGVVVTEGVSSLISPEVPTIEPPPPPPIDNIGDAGEF